MVPKEEEPGQDMEQSRRFEFSFTITGEQRFWLVQQMTKVYPQKISRRLRDQYLLDIVVFSLTLLYRPFWKMPFALFLVVCPIMILYRSYSIIFYQRTALASARKLWKGKRAVAEMVLDDQGYWDIIPNKKTLYYYSGIINICRCGEWYLLFANKNLAFCLPLSGLTYGDPTALEAFLEERTGKPVTVLEEAET